ncbi:MAG: glycoside hydrolase [Planctomycetes bacterium]|nr:glycoside hydrolase [Planctomycetota bacterium]
MKQMLAMWALASAAGIFAGASAGAQEVLLTIEPNAKQPRNSEGDIIQLKDGRLCLIYTRFTGGGSDHSAADLAMRVSPDGGRSWSDDRIVVRRDSGQNVMSVSLLRLADSRIALFYMNKQSIQDCRPVMRISTDECRTFGPPVACITDEIGYYVLNNDRAVQLSDRRLVLPVAMHNKPGQAQPDWAGRVMCYLSDDIGRTWRRSKSVLIGRSPEGNRVTVQEPGVVELQNGRLMMFCRTNAGSQYVSFSEDHGDTWSELRASNLRSPLSPASIERIPWSGELLCVWNDHSGVHAFPAGKRTPLCLAISRDDGGSWSRSRVIEPDPDGWYCYTAITCVGDQVLLAYCAGDSKVGRLNRLKVVSLSRELLNQLSAAPSPRPEAMPNAADDQD